MKMANNSIKIDHFPAVFQSKLCSAFDIYLFFKCYPCGKVATYAVGWV